MGGGAYVSGTVKQTGDPAETAHLDGFDGQRRRAERLPHGVRQGDGGRGNGQFPVSHGVGKRRDSRLHGTETGQREKHIQHTPKQHGTKTPLNTRSVPLTLRCRNAIVARSSKCPEDAYCIRMT